MVNTVKTAVNKAMWSDRRLVENKALSNYHVTVQNVVEVIKNFIYDANVSFFLLKLIPL